jgi:hypothetical protein
LWLVVSIGGVFAGVAVPAILAGDAARSPAPSQRKIRVRAPAERPRPERLPWPLGAVE